MAHNKTLAAQLYAEFKRLFPDNAIEYFVSYYDYYQPEAYVPRHDLYIEKSTDINEQIERLRLSATASLFSRRDVLIVASVSCIYGIGDPVNWQQDVSRAQSGRRSAARTGSARPGADSVPPQRHGVAPRHIPRARRHAWKSCRVIPRRPFRIYLWGDEIEKIVEFHPLTGEVVHVHELVTIFPAREYITDEEHIREALHDIEIELEEQINYFKREDKLIEAQRIEQRTRYDIEMLREVGFTTGIENYSRHFDRRAAGQRALHLDRLSARGSSAGHRREPHDGSADSRHVQRRSRRANRSWSISAFVCPARLDNRPLQFNEFWERVGQTIYTSATPGPYEGKNAEQVVEQIIRPTGIVDPQVDVRPISAIAYPQIEIRSVEGQIDDMLQEIALQVRKQQRALVSTLTKRMAEELAGFLTELGIKAIYVHSTSVFRSGMRLLTVCEIANMKC